MTCLLITVFSDSSIVRLGEITSALLAYSRTILVNALSYYWTASREAGERCTASSKVFRVVTCTTNVLEILSKAALANSCLSISSTRLVMGKASVAL